MKVLMIGTGAVGIGIGASLVAGGLDVDFLTHGKNETYLAMKEKGIRRSGLFDEIAIGPEKIGVYSDYEDLPKNAYDAMLIAVKTHGNEEVAARLDSVRNCRKKEAPILFLQNGIGLEEGFQPYFTENSFYHSRILTGFQLKSKNESVITSHQDDILIGSLYRNMLGRVRFLADAIDESGLPTSLDTEIEMPVWSKLIAVTTLDPLSSILGKTYGELVESEYSRNIMDILIEESFTVMRAAGKKCEQESAEDFRRYLYKELVPKMREQHGMDRKEIKKRTEMETLNGALLRIAGKYNEDCPVHTMIYWEIKAMEEA